MDKKDWLDVAEYFVNYFMDMYKKVIEQSEISLIEMSEEDKKLFEVEDETKENE